MKDELFEVGEYVQAFNEMTEQNMPCGKVYQSSGLVAHVRKHHPGDVDLLKHVGQVICKPDFIGKNPKENDSVELVKQIDKNVMVCIKLDTKNGYLFVASVYPISTGKLNNRLNSGRLKKC